MRIGRMLAGVALGVAVGACSTEGASSPAVDASIGYGGAIGAPCQPSAKNPCEVLTDVCSVSMCDPSTHVCVRVPVEAGPTCGNGVPPADDSGAVESGDAALDAGDAADAAVEAGSDSSILDATSEASDGSGEASRDAEPDADAGGD